MPEGPEVYALSYAINAIVPGYTTSIGKHLVIKNGEDWSFGLSGRVYMDESGTLAKVNTGYIPGTVKVSLENNLGPSWCHISDTSILQILIDKWSKSKKKLGAILLDQNEISGIGVAWGSEILYEAGLRPDIAANIQLDNTITKEALLNAILTKKTYVIELYTDFICKSSNKRKFINDWFNNLYEIRMMKVYKKGKQVEVAGRKWWI
jgi:Formamidopyrimidine-DNA glycosylase H2TH domain